MFIIWRFDPPCGLVFISVLFLPIGVKITTYAPSRLYSCNYVIGMSKCLILGVSLSFLTCEITASFYSCFRSNTTSVLKFTLLAILASESILTSTTNCTFSVFSKIDGSAI